MFDIGWTEMLVIAVVMIVVVGPKDLPKMLRTFGRTTTKLRSMAGDFQKQFNEALKEAELDDVKSSVDSLRGMNPMNEIRKQLNPFEKAAADVRSGIDNAMKPMPKPEVPSATAGAVAAEPLKNGATVLAGVAGPDKMPEPPVIAPPAIEAAMIAGTARAAPKAAKVAKAGPVKQAKPTAAKAAPAAKAAAVAKAAPAAKVVSAAKVSPASTAAKVAPAKAEAARIAVVKTSIAKAPVSKTPVSQPAVSKAAPKKKPAGKIQ